MKKKTACMLFTLALAAAANIAAGFGENSISAGDSRASLVPLSAYQAVAVQRTDDEEGVELLLADESGVQKTIFVPCPIQTFSVLPAQTPEFLFYDPASGTTSWAQWQGDQLALLREWDGSYQTVVKPEGVMLASRREGSIEFVDPQRQTVLHATPSLSQFIFDDVIWADDAWLLLARTDTAESLYRIIKLSRSGEILWTLEFPWHNIGTASFYPDGAGGAWIPHALAYTGPTALDHISSDGILDHTVLLGGEPRVTYLYANRTPEPGAVTLYGTSVAHSKGVYQVFALTLNCSGDALDLDVRDYTARKDYSISLSQAADGAVYVGSNGYENQPPLLVPFDSLPQAASHGLTLQKAEGE